MSTIVFSPAFASAYSSNTYNTSTYGGSTTQTSTGTAAGGSLTNTGIAVASFITIACLILLVAIVVRVWRRPAKKADVHPEV